MINSTLNYGIKSYEDYFLKNEYSFLSTVFEKIMKNSQKNFIITDNKLNIIYSNSAEIKSSDEIMKKLKLTLKQISKPQTSIIRRLKSDFGTIKAKIIIEPINTDSNIREGYLFIVEKIAEKDLYKDKYEKLISFLKHDLKTPVSAQITALNLIQRNSENNILIPEILHSCEITQRLIKNIIEEDKISKNTEFIAKKRISAKEFIKDFEKNCISFLETKNNKLFVKNELKTTVLNLDKNKTEKALVNILFQINERCYENQTITITFREKKQMINICIRSKSKALKKDLFCEFTKKEAYEKIGFNNGLLYAKEIISAHGGRFFSRQIKDYSTMSINIPF